MRPPDSLLVLVVLVVVVLVVVVESRPRALRGDGKFSTLCVVSKMSVLG